MENEVAESSEKNPQSTSQDTQSTEQLQELATGLAEQSQIFLGSMLRPWNAYQIGITLVLLLLAWLLAKYLSPRLQKLMRAREGWKKWQLRLFVIFNQRLWLIFLTVLLWSTYLTMQELTWPSRSYLVGVFASLSLAWLLIALLTRIIANAF